MAVTVTGTEDLLRRLKAIGEPRPILRVLQLQAVREAKKIVPRKTGDLGRSIVKGSLTDRSAIVEARASYAAYVELGTKPHVILPKNGRVLAWPATAAGRRLSGRANARALRGAPKVGKTTGTFSYARSVKHPGTRAQPYLLSGARKALERGGFAKIIETKWNEAA